VRSQKVVPTVGWLRTYRRGWLRVVAVGNSNGDVPMLHFAGGIPRAAGDLR
jgi:phosphoserine phosphatase